MRDNAYPSRFNFWGHISLYLSSSEKCAIKELGRLKKNKRRWVGTFTPSEDLCLMNLFIPTTKDELKQLDSYDKFCLLLTYPFYLLCLTKSSNKKQKSMPEEYYFPQLLFHLMFLSDNPGSNKIDYPKFQGIIYNSMKIKKEANVVIPSRYEVGMPNKDSPSPFIHSLIKKSREPYVLTNQ